MRSVVVVPWWAYLIGGVVAVAVMVAVGFVLLVFAAALVAARYGWPLAYGAVSAVGAALGARVTAVRSRRRRRTLAMSDREVADQLGYPRAR